MTAPAHSLESFHVAVQGRGIQKEPSGLLELLRPSSELKEAKAIGMGLDMQRDKVPDRRELRRE